MFVFYKTETGLIDFTVGGESYPQNLLKEGMSVLEVDMHNLTDLAGWKVENGELVQFDIEPIKSLYIAKVISVISAIRSAYVTDIPGQEMIYMNKEKEAAEYVAATSPDLSIYPMLQTEVGVTAPSAYEVAQIWLFMGHQWRIIAAALERVRMIATNDIQAATTEAEILTAFETFNATLASMPQNFGD